MEHSELSNIKWYIFNWCTLCKRNEFNISSRRKVIVILHQKKELRYCFWVRQDGTIQLYNYNLSTGANSSTVLQFYSSTFYTVIHSTNSTLQLHMSSCSTGALLQLSSSPAPALSLSRSLALQLTSSASCFCSRAVLWQLYRSTSTGLQLNYRSTALYSSLQL